MDGGPLSLESIADDLEMPETFSYIIYFKCFNSSSWDTPSVLTGRVGKEFGLCASDSSPEGPWMDLPGGS